MTERLRLGDRLQIGGRVGEVIEWDIPDDRIGRIVTIRLVIVESPESDRAPEPRCTTCGAPGRLHTMKTRIPGQTFLDHAFVPQPVEAPDDTSWIQMDYLEDLEGHPIRDWLRRRVPRSAPPMDDVDGGRRGD